MVSDSVAPGAGGGDPREVGRGRGETRLAAGGPQAKTTSGRHRQRTWKRSCRSVVCSTRRHATRRLGDPVLRVRQLLDELVRVAYEEYMDGGRAYPTEDPAGYESTKVSRWLDDHRSLLPPGVSFRAGRTSPTRFRAQQRIEIGEPGPRGGGLGSGAVAPSRESSRIPGRIRMTQVSPTGSAPAAS